MPPPRILVVEDEPDVRRMLKALLEDESYEVLEAADGLQAVEQALAESPDLVLLDLRLPGLPGLQACREIRARSGVPIICLTAQVSRPDVVAGLEAGADDYVTKPFDADELAARIRANLRRATTPEVDRITIGALEINPVQAVVRLHGRELQLTKTEFKILCEFATHPGMLLSREQLLDRVWGYDYLGDSRLVDAHIRRLRTKIEEDPSSPQHLVTVRGLGYRLEP